MSQLGHAVATSIRYLPSTRTLNPPYTITPLEIDASVIQQLNVRKNPYAFQLQNPKPTLLCQNVIKTKYYCISNNFIFLCKI